eukprot:2325022-Pyramimonas_sp.AAC.1
MEAREKKRGQRRSGDGQGSHGGSDKAIDPYRHTLIFCSLQDSVWPAWDMCNALGKPRGREARARRGARSAPFLRSGTLTC